MPLLGGWIADSYLGRYATIQYSIIAAILGHVLLICSAIPTVMDNPSGALGLFAVGLVIMGIGTGGFKSNISPLLAEQIKQTRPEVITLKTGERVIKDPQVTISRVFLYFYMMINLGALSGGIGMVYAERFIGFWLSYALPTFLFFLAPLVLIVRAQAIFSNFDVTSDIYSRNRVAKSGTFSHHQRARCFRKLSHCSSSRAKVAGLLIRPARIRT